MSVILFMVFLVSIAISIAIFYTQACISAWSSQSLCYIHADSNTQLTVESSRSEHYEMVDNILDLKNSPGACTDDLYAIPDMPAHYEVVRRLYQHCYYGYYWNFALAMHFLP